ncbi:glycerophosphodiester phosphodiesterase family protein [Lacinutrix sp. 5H-3-7-4]|uniref:glycerophosphodiester phosphodiesterase n=1 Tax=Lacinutrix sp. (strain 5H-3-7-4) TaxID=983544 RepID=UPI00020A3BBC|nr:glycerophosphodiester phosphodiesterase family protein [Lacinutrix sp. 5H-3-7-4]AEH00513.1 glycerophosphoryl diester phosphodiesterase [Lacinutrix sp. 5H-3-7-4]
MQTLNIGHRGAKGYVTENTIASVNKALELKVDGIEIDVHLCKSGELVVFHDFTLDRLTNGTGEVSSYTLKELQELKVEQEHKIPTLQEVLNTINKKCLLNIELKGKNTASKTVELIESYIQNQQWNYSNFIVSSFQHKELTVMYNLNSKIPLGVLTKANLEEAITFAKTIETKILHPNFALLSENNVKNAQKNGYIINTWTVNTPKAIARMKKYNVNAIISDFPDRVL